jgi:hypothetical protein
MFLVNAFVHIQIPVLKEQLREKERQLEKLSLKTTSSDLNVMTNSWHQAMTEAKRQYDAIDGALEVFFFKLISLSSSAC